MMKVEMSGRSIDQVVVNMVFALLPQTFLLCLARTPLEDEDRNFWDVY